MSEVEMEVESTGLVDTWKCSRCAMPNERSERNRHLCVDCERAENNRYSHFRNNQQDWMEQAEEQDIKVWDQQPGETQWEYTIWQAYRAHYPGKKPSYQSVAEQLQTTSGVVRKVAQRWTFQARMQAWIAENSRVVEATARQQILTMNQQHMGTAMKLQDKLAQAVDSIDPAALRPGEIATLMKVSADIERKARVDDIAQYEMLVDLNQDRGSKDEKVATTKQGDLNEVLKILQSAGAIPGMVAGVKTTTTTEVVVKTSDEEGDVLNVD